MLNQHFVDGRLAEVRIKRLAAEFEKRIERLLKLLVIFVGLFDFVFESEGELGTRSLKSSTACSKPSISGSMWL